MGLSWVLCKPPTSWLLGCEFLLPSLANIHAVSLVDSSLPRPYPSPADGNTENAPGWDCEVSSYDQVTQFHRQRRPVGYSPWGGKELDMTEQLKFLLFPPPGHAGKEGPQLATQVRLHGYLQEKGGGIQNPVIRRWSACMERNIRSRTHA